MVDFSGWEMPINYGSQIEEHQAVRQHAGVFDVSHMTVIDIAGVDAKAYLRMLLANDVEKLQRVGKALYSAMLNPQGGVIDDLIVYKMDYGYRVVVNCGTRAKDLDWMQLQAKPFDVQINERAELAILAVHGPLAIDLVCKVLESSPGLSVQAIRELGNFQGIELDQWFIARTGYTGEKGLELIFPASQAADFWDRLLQAGVKPIGLGARDTLRLEAGMNLYGHDMDESVSPLAANMEQTVDESDEQRDFIGKAAIAQHRIQQEQGELPILAGLTLLTRGVLREGQKVITDKGEGIITSGSFSPTLKHSIALARIPVGSTACQVDLRGKLTEVSLVKPNFVRFGKSVIRS